MILILSQNISDPTTEIVADWIEALGGTWDRLNGEDLEGAARFGIELSPKGSASSLSFSDRNFSIGKISVIWFRRWHQLLGLGVEQFVRDAPLYSSTLSHQAKELAAATRAIFSEFKEAKWLTTESTVRTHKLLVLKDALSVGLEVPGTMVTNDKKTAIEFKRRYGRVVVKPLTDASSFPCGTESALMYTSELTDEVMGHLPDHFFPSMLQEMIEKSFEIRTFFLYDNFYSMAIFSQGDPQTSVDFRRYNRRVPNRTVPYNLPDEIRCRLRVLLDKLNLETASIDLIRCIDGRYIFLEVNPVGQFGMLSRACNYNLYKK